MDYLELRFTEILQYKVEKPIHFELIATSTSRDELGKLSGKPDFGLFEIKLQLLTPTRNLTSLELNSQQLILLVIIKVLYLRCLNLKLQGSKL